jgi:hypothetical protein
MTFAGMTQRPLSAKVVRLRWAKNILLQRVVPMNTGIGVVVGRQRG